MTDVHTLLAQNVKKYRQILGISQAGLAERINCSTTLIGNIEIKRRFPSPKNLDLIAKALGVKPADLFTEEDEPEQLSLLAVRQEQKEQLKREVIESIERVLK